MPYDTLLNRAKVNRSRPTPSIFGGMGSGSKPKHQFPGVVVAHDQNEKAMVIQRIARQNILCKSSPALKKTASSLQQQVKFAAAGAEPAVTETSGTEQAAASEPGASGSTAT